MVLALHVGDLVTWVTPFADDWSDLVRGLLRGLLAVAVLVAALLLASSMFVGLTLTVGDPFYERIWRATEESLGGPVPEHEPGVMQAARDGLVLSAVGLACSAAVVVAGFVPVVGPVGGVVLGVTLSARLLSRELLSGPWWREGSTPPRNGPRSLRTGAPCSGSVSRHSSGSWFRSGRCW